MINEELAEIFGEMADIEEIEGNRWESLAYRKVSANITALGEDIREIYKRNELRKIDGVGSAIEKKIQQYIQDGKIDTYEKLKQKYPVDFRNLRKIQGLGPKKIGALFVNLGVTDIESLKRAIDAHKVAGLPGFGEKTEANLLKGIQVYSRSGASRILLGRAYGDIESLRSYLESTGLFDSLIIAGSARRMRESIGDLDILASSTRRKEAADAFINSEFVSGVVVSGESKITVNLKLGITCDLRFIDADSIGAALQYFTGSKDHNVHLRDLAIFRGLKLNEYGLFRGETRVAGSDEKGIYESLGLAYIQPELRENTGEIEAAMNGSLPGIVDYGDIKSDLHMHTNDSDGRNSLVEMLDHAKKSGLEYIAMTNHSVGLKIAHGLDAERFSELNARIDEESARIGIPALKGVELEILRDGSLDLSPNTIDQMDYVLAALHQYVSSNREENTGRIVKAIESGRINALAHPTGRLIGNREMYSIDLDAVVEKCIENKVFIEINGFPERSDLPADIVRRVHDSGVMFALGSDAHSISDLRFIRFAAAIARRGWLTREKIVNALNLNDFRKLLTK
ncbi:MAG: DNA polymerase/3'-5' exonuclease PolX [Candidatus Thermoplasmatota archaeon]|nr:DNA polymerase/3'-5' exonuclease PolX [Candidatus Thermoplasmatota archaeon]